MGTSTVCLRAITTAAALALFGPPAYATVVPAVVKGQSVCRADRVGSRECRTRVRFRPATQDYDIALRIGISARRLKSSGCTRPRRRQMLIWKKRYSSVLHICLCNTDPGVRVTPIAALRPLSQGCAAPSRPGV